MGAFVSIVSDDYDKANISGGFYSDLLLEYMISTDPRAQWTFLQATSYTSRILETTSIDST
jgi:hypothetical protein